MLNIDSFEQQLTPFIESDRPIVVALSGGIDSVVLLHLCAALHKNYPAMRLSACHVHHGISANANQWQGFCQQLCAQWHVDYSAFRVNLDDYPENGMEAQARSARYSVLTTQTPVHAVVVTGHHQQDQAETFLLRLKRGSGPAGLGSMTGLRRLDTTRILVRPLLKESRSDIESYATAHALSWIEDESNQDSRFERNFLRNDVLPLLRQRWPQMDMMIARSAQLCHEQQQLVDELLQHECASRYGKGLFDQQGLSLNGFFQLSAVMQKGLIRAWLKAAGANLLPSNVLLSRIINEVAAAKADGQPAVAWGTWQVRRFQNRLYLICTDKVVTPHECVWGEQTDLAIDGIGWVTVEPVADNLTTEATVSALPQLILPKHSLSQVVVSTRLPTGKISLAYRDGRKTITQILKEAAVPPWCRDSLPFVYLNGEILGVPGVFITEKVAQLKQQAGPLIALNWARASS